MSERMKNILVLIIYGRSKIKIVNKLALIIVYYNKMNDNIDNRNKLNN